jgi:hypothetical protein
LNELLAAIIGGFLAAGTGWFLQYRLEAARLERGYKLLLVGICDDLKASLELYERLLDEWGKTQVVWFTTLNELRESRQIYLKNREWLILVKDENLRQKVFRYYHRSAEHINLLENQQRRKYDIQAKLNDLVRDLQLRTPQLVREQGLQQAASLMQAEDQELFSINSALPQSIQRLRDFKVEAKDLLSALSR